MLYISIYINFYHHMLNILPKKLKEDVCRRGFISLILVEMLGDDLCCIYIELYVRVRVFFMGRVEDIVGSVFIDLFSCLLLLCIILGWMDILRGVGLIRLRRVENIYEGSDHLCILLMLHILCKMSYDMVPCISQAWLMKKDK